MAAYHRPTSADLTAGDAALPSADPSLSRRRFLALSALALGTAPLACGANATPDLNATDDPARISARPQDSITPIAAGRHALGVDAERAGFLYFPASCAQGKPSPLLTLFHGAGQRSDEFAAATEMAEQLGVILVVPDSRGRTWDRIRGDFGPDVAFTNAALERAFRHCSVDAKRIGFGGFSDGASYALSLGLTNGDLVTHVLAFSPGFLTTGKKRGSPRLYITHGKRDQILPIDATSRRIVPALKADGYLVTYKEFDGQHEVPRPLGTAAFEWFVKGA